MSIKKSNFMQKLYVGLVLSATSMGTFASTTGSNPWEQMTTKVVDSVTGPVAWGVITAAIAISGFSMSFMELSGGVKKLVQAAFGGSIAVGAASIVTSFIGFKGVCI